jgi:hypothetical protein
MCPVQLADICTILLSRLTLPLVISATALALATSFWPAATAPLLVATQAALSPIPAAAPHFARVFRLNESFAQSLRHVSQWIGLPLLLVLPVVAAGCGYSGGVVPGGAAAGEGGAAAAGAATAVAGGMSRTARACWGVQQLMYLTILLLAIPGHLSFKHLWF